METAFKKVYDLYLQGFIGTDDWLLIMRLFFNWALSQYYEPEDLIQAWMRDVQKDHLNLKGKIVK